MDIALRATELVWLGGLAAVPVALGVGLACRVRGCRPATRHALWCAVLLSFITPVIGGLAWRPGWFQSERVLAAADSLASPRVPSEPAVESPIDARASETLNPASAAPSPNRVEAASEVDVRGAARLVSYLFGRAWPALTGAGTDADWPARVADGLRHVSEATQVWSGLQGTPDTARAPVVQRSVEPVRAAVATPEGPARTVSMPLVEVTNAPVRAATRAVETEPVPARAAAAPARPEADWRREARAWLAGVLAVRDAVAAAPPVPGVVWGAGAALIGGVWLMRVISARRVLGRGRPAPAAMLGLVESCAGELGLRRAPGVLVVDERVSPMIWCGLRPWLVIPEGLWAELDAPSQRAVVLHELAHLKRRDHQMCWLESLVGLAYWWHPAAWWVRKRIREEADLACDAWVLSVMPTGRRAYAEALVTTRSFLSRPGCRVTPGLGVMTGRTKRLARRLTMVMTQRVAPRTSAVGAVLAIGVAMAGMFVTPGLACPPEEGQPAKVIVVPKAKAQGRAKAERAMKAEKSAKARAQGAPGVEFFGEAPALDAMRAKARSAGPEAEDGELQRLEEQLRVLEERLEQLNRRAAHGAGHSKTPSARSPLHAGIAVPAAPGVAVAPPAPGFTVTVPGEPVAPTPPAPPVAPIAPMPALPEHSLAVLGHGAINLAPLAVATADEATEARSYTLPEGKLDALTGLMSREDVPVLIQRFPDHLLVHATPAQHEVFKAFVQLIHPDGRVASTQGRAAPRAWSEADVTRNRLSAARAARAGQLRALEGQLRGLAGQRSGLESQARAMERQADRLREQAEKLREKAESFREESEHLRSEGQKTEPGMIESLLARAQAAEIEAQHAEEMADHLEAQTSELESAAESIEDSADELEAQIENAAQAIEEEVEAAEEPADTTIEQSSAEDCETTVTETAQTTEAPASPGGN